MEAVAPGLEADAPALTGGILLVAPPARGGLAQHVSSLAAALHALGYRVGVASPPDGPIVDLAGRLSLPFYSLRFGSTSCPSRAAMAALQVVRAAAHLQAQVVHTHSFMAGLAGALAVRLARGPRLVVTIHNYPPRADGMRPAGRFQRWAVGQVVRRADRIITVSQRLRQDLTEVFPGAAEKTLVIPNGVDLGTNLALTRQEARRKLGLPESAPVVAMVARLAPQKGIVEFLRACAEVARRWPEARFALIGEGPLRGEAERLREELGLADQLCLPGQVASARALMPALDCLVVASTSEGSSVVAMEAMAEGRPVVATRVGGVPEVVGDGETGLLVEPGDPGALAERICELLGDPERARRMGERGRQRAAAEFDVRMMVERMQQVYAPLLGGGARRSGR